MKSKDLKELHLKTIQELEKIAGDAREALEKLSLEELAGKVVNRVQVKNKKHEIAQILTILGQKKGKS